VKPYNNLNEETLVTKWSSKGLASEK
jgi:hypothetical protein